jgi:hypothetical protein
MKAMMAAGGLFDIESRAGTVHSHLSQWHQVYCKSRITVGSVAIAGFSNEFQVIPIARDNKAFTMILQLFFVVGSLQCTDIDITAVSGS